MARMVNIICNECGNSKSEAVGAGDLVPNICGSCHARKRNIERIKHLGGLKALPIEARLAKIEELLYDAPWEMMMKRHTAKF